MDPDKTTDLARGVQEHGGAPRDDPWFERVKRNDGSRHDVSLPDPVPVIVHEWIPDPTRSRFRLSPPSGGEGFPAFLIRLDSMRMGHPRDAFRVQLQGSRACPMVLASVPNQMDRLGAW